MWIDMGCEPTGLGQAPFLHFFSFPFLFFSSLIPPCFSIALLKCVWRHLGARFMRLGGWKGVECLVSSCRLKNIDR
jgi:hypothetical protein